MIYSNIKVWVTLLVMSKFSLDTIVSLHPVSITRFPSFRTQTLENLSHYLWTKTISEQPRPWRKSCERESCYGDRVYGLYYHFNNHAWCNTMSHTIVTRLLLLLLLSNILAVVIIMKTITIIATVWGPEAGRQKEVDVRHIHIYIYIYIYIHTHHVCVYMYVYVCIYGETTEK